MSRPALASAWNRLLGSDTLLRLTVRALRSGAAFSRRSQEHKRSAAVPARVVHLSPSYFDDTSVIGGGERYATELACAMAELVDTTLVTFGERRRRVTTGRLRIEIYPAIKLMHGVKFDPLSYGFLRALVGADVVHCHQYKTTVTGLAILAGATLHKRLYVTDLGGGTTDLSGAFPLGNLIDRNLPISEFAGRVLEIGRASSVIHGGVDPSLFAEKPSLEKAQDPRALFVGRLLPHKGINYLVEAAGQDIALDIIGRPYSAPYFEHLTQLAAGKKVRFLTDMPDENLAAAYSGATVTVLPSVYVDMYGQRQEKPELLGLVLLESMACGTPVICTNVGGMPEFVEDGVNGFVVPPNDPAALRSRLTFLIENPEIARAMGANGKARVLANYTWPVVARRCFDLYGETGA